MGSAGDLNETLRSCFNEEAFDLTKVAIEEVTPVDSRYGRFGGRCILAHGVLLPEECHDIMTVIGPELQGLHWKLASNAVSTRISDGFQVHSKSIADVLWGRLDSIAQGLALFVDSDPKKQRLLAQEPGDCPDELYVGPCREGIWMPDRLNDRLGFHRYSPGGFFRPHTDMCVDLSEDDRSFFTCLFYLDSNMSGGDTRFFRLDMALRVDEKGPESLDEDVVASVSPRQGSCLLFFQPGLVHDGADLVSGLKHFIRGDMMFRRDPTTKPERTEEQEEAASLVRQAQIEEEASNCDVACNLYRRAFKLDPRLERLF